MALYLSNPSAIINMVVHKGDVFVDGNTVYIAKLSGYPQNLEYRVGRLNYSTTSGVINGIPYSTYTDKNNQKGAYPFPVLVTSPEEIAKMLDAVNKIDYSVKYNSYHEYYMETRLPIPKGLVCLDTSSNKYYVTTSACYLSTLLKNIVELPVITEYEDLGWRYHAEYKAGDLVIFDGYVYECVKANTSEDTPVSETEHTYWTQYVEARTTALDYVMPYQLLSLTNLISYKADSTFSSNFTQSFTEPGLKGMAEEKDIKNAVAGWLYNTIGNDTAHHGTAPYNPRVEDWKTTLGGVTYILPVCLGTVQKHSPSHYPVDTIKDGDNSLSKYCPFLGSSVIIPEINYISTGTVDAYYAGEVFSDGTYIYYITKTKVGSLSDCALKIMNTSIINIDTMFFAPPPTWFKGKTKDDHQLPGRSIGLASDIFTNVTGKSYRDVKPTCLNLAHDRKKYTYATKAEDETAVHLPYANTTENQKSVILTDYNYIIVNSVKGTNRNFNNGAMASQNSSSMRDIRYTCKGRFVGEFTVDDSMVTDDATKTNVYSTRALVDVYYVLKDDDKYGDIDKWLSDETYTIWCFRINVCSKEVLSMNSDSESYISKYGIKNKANKIVDLKPKKISVTSLKGYDKLPDSIKEKIKNIEIIDPNSPVFNETEIPSKAIPKKAPSHIDIKDPSTGDIIAKIDGDTIKPPVEKGDKKEKPDEGKDGCAFNKDPVIWSADEDGVSFDTVKKSKIAKYYNGIPVYFSKEYANTNIPSDGSGLYLDDNRKVIYRKNGADVDTVGEETVNGEVVAFYYNKLSVIKELTGTIHKNSYWISDKNIYKANLDLSIDRAEINSSYFTWVGRYARHAYSCSNVVNLPILSENEEVCGVKAGNKTIYNKGDGTGVIIDVVKPAARGQLKLENQIVLGNIKLGKVETKKTLENGVDVDYRENSIVVDDTEDEDVSTAEYAKGTLFYIEKSKTAYYATKDCTYEEIYKIYPIDYYVYKNNDECKLIHGIKYLIYKDTGRNESIRIYKRKSYTFKETVTPIYYVEGDDVYKEVDKETDRSKTKDKIVARFSNDKLVWLNDKDRDDKPDSNCSPRGIYDNDTLVWYETEFTTLKANTYYLYKNNVYRTLQDNVTEKEFGLSGYSGLYGQLYAQGKMLIWYCPPVTKLIAGTVFKYSTKIYVATGDISVDDWDKVDISKLSVKQIGFIEEHTQDCKLIYGDIVLYDTEYPLCYIFNTGEKVDITSPVSANTEIFNAVSNETIVQVKNPANKDTITNSIEENTVVATKNIQDNTGEYRWLFHSFDTTAEIVNNYLYKKDEDTIYFSEDACKIIKIYGYYVKLREFICPISCQFPYGITHKIYRLKDGINYNNNEYLLREFIYYKEKYSKNNSYFLDGDYVYYKDKDGNNNVVARYVNGELISYSCFINKEYTEDLFDVVGLYEKSIDVYFLYSTMVGKIYSGVVFLDESEIYLSKTNIQDTQNINLNVHKDIGTMIARDNIPVFNYVYKNTPTLYYKETNTKKNIDFVYRITENSQRIAVGVYGIYRLNIKPHVKDYVLSLSEYPTNCCYKLHVGELVYTGKDILNPKIGDKIYEIINEICANEFIPQLPTPSTPQKEICYVVLIDCMGKTVWIFDYYSDSEYLSKTFVEIKNESKNVSNIMFYKCYISEVDGHKYCTWQEVCSIVGCNRPLELTADIPVKLPTYIGATDQRVWDKILANDIINLKGCEMNIRTWSMYKVTLGGESNNKIPYNKDYTYTWNYITKDFTVVDNTTGETIYSKSNCETFSDLGINLDTVVSCNFIFIAKNKFVESGLIPVRENKILLNAVPEKFELGVDNSYRADRVRPYKKDDADNPTNKIYHVISNPKIEGNYSIKLQPHISTKNIEGSSTEDNKISALMDEVFNKYGETTYLLQTKQLPNNKLYLPDAYTPFTVVDTKKKLRVTQVKLTITLAELSMCLYQMLLPVERVGEVNNNRPVYEPWLVWGFYKLIYSKGTKAEDVPIVYPIFDLSPVYG